jgi:MFS transporter, putative metabolite:H+ symporter
MPGERSYSNILNRVVLIAGLGYFVDVYDLVLFAVVRVESLQASPIPSRFST